MRALDEWEVVATEPGRFADPWQVEWHGVTRSASGASESLAGRVDALDWWYRCTFDDADAAFLRFDGLATLATVWVNGEVLLESNNMFERHRVDVRGRLRGQNELVICCRSLDTELAKRRPRPRWKTRLVRNQQLRWIRTSLRGRIPAWSPDGAPVGPWRPVVLESMDDPREVELRTYLDGTTGVIELSCSAREGTLIAGDVEAELHDGHATLRIGEAALWWPHTHGQPFLYPLSLRIAGATHDLGGIGFRHVDFTSDSALRVNDVEVFARGACWSGGTVGDLRRLHEAGANMVRVGGTFVYEDDAFYAACDELGIVVWQDFMFANMDYPADDPEFVASVRREATQQLQRLRRHPSVAIWCGNSEVEQQAAMVGAPRELWHNALFAELLPSLCRELHPNAAYVPSTPSGGTLPFQTSAGVTHYYGVGAYMRPLSDVRRAEVRFASECLGFSNVPAQAVVDAVMEGESFAPHDPRWKRGVPRDSGSAYDFEDVRNHYLRELFGVESRVDLDLARLTTGEVMSRVFSEWRSTHGRCHGGLVWFAKDLRPGAGWGVLDHRGVPKACYYALKRVWQPRTVVLTDEGLNGIHAHVINELDTPLTATLEITLLRDGHVVVAHASTPCSVAPRSKQRFEAEAVLGAFHDTAYAYRFGPPQHEVVIATLLVNDETIAEAFHFIHSEALRGTRGTLTAVATADTVTLTSDRFLYGVHFDAAPLLPDDDWFHLAPGRPKTVQLRGEGKLAGYVEALNLGEPVRIVTNG